MPSRAPRRQQLPQKGPYRRAGAARTRAFGSNTRRRIPKRTFTPPKSCTLPRPFVLRSSSCPAKSVYRKWSSASSPLRPQRMSSPRGGGKGASPALSNFRRARPRTTELLAPLTGHTAELGVGKPGATPDRILQAMKDVKEFPSSLHLAAWEIGAWPALLAATQAAMSLGWVINFPPSFCQSLPERRDFHCNMPESSSEEEPGEAKKRKLEDEQSGAEEPDK